MPVKEPVKEKPKKRIVVEETSDEEETPVASDEHKEDTEKEVEEVEEKEEETVVETAEKTAEKEEAEEKPVETPVHDQKISSFSLLDVDKPKEEMEQTEVADSAKAEETPMETPSEAKEEISSDEVKNWLKDVRPDTSSQDLDKESKPGFKSILIIVILIGVIGAVIGGIFYYRSKVGKTSLLPQKEAQNTTVTPMPTTSVVSPTPTSSQSADLTKYSVSVLNGSGVTGEAGKAKDLLTKAGFTKVTTGNASTYDYTSTEITVKKGTPDSVVSAIQTALSGTYTVTVKDTNLDSSSSLDVQVIVSPEK